LTKNGPVVNESESGVPFVVFSNSNHLISLFFEILSFLPPFPLSFSLLPRSCPFFFPTHPEFPEIQLQSILIVCESRKRLWWRRLCFFSCIARILFGVHFFAQKKVYDASHFLVVALKRRSKTTE